ncbi:hypothetical protein IWW57_006507, partial [Coemansia sp. S610]
PSTLLVGTILAAIVSGEEGAPTPTGEATHGARAGSKDKNAIDKFIETHSNKLVASAVKSFIEEQSSALSKKPEILSQLYAMQGEFIDDLNKDNFLDRISSFASKLEKLGGSDYNKPMGLAAVAFLAT